MAVAAAAAAAAAATATVTAEAATATVSGNAAGDAVATATATEALHPDAVVGDLLETGVDQLLGDVADHAVHRVRPSVRLGAAVACQGIAVVLRLSRARLCASSLLLDLSACPIRALSVPYPLPCPVPYPVPHPCPIRVLSSGHPAPYPPPYPVPYSWRRVPYS